MLSIGGREVLIKVNLKLYLLDFGGRKTLGKMVCIGALENHYAIQKMKEESGFVIYQKSWFFNSKTDPCKILPQLELFGGFFGTKPIIDIKKHMVFQSLLKLRITLEDWFGAFSFDLEGLLAIE
ncbi:hypothetical protein EPI10_020236 [Gossypium australe]|uniref:Uncharacterized protein n=1 Tax=Gossypium australe TaxID=47621 RepID=A0A5B6WF08_9ROSI|nr:hypothetical protein EPI10_020236 [Gossypium australe]